MESTFPQLRDRIAKAIDDYPARIIPPEHKAPLRDLIYVEVLALLRQESLFL